jgi:hypothetical protein
MPEIVLCPTGNLGNQMLQLISAMSLRKSVPGLQISGYEMPLWNLGNVRYSRRLPFIPKLGGFHPDTDELCALFNSGAVRIARLRGIACDCTVYDDIEIFRALFKPPDLAIESTGPEELLISVRGEEILQAIHTGYGPIRIGFYRSLIETTGLRPVFFGQLGSDYYSSLLRASFPQARFVPSRGVMADFETIRRASHIALSVSTFAWLAAWLSHATTIHMPLLGSFNPLQRPDIWLCPLDDQRYRFYAFEERHWKATPSQIAELASDAGAPRLGHEELMQMRSVAIAEKRLITAPFTARFRTRARLAYPLVRALEYLVPSSGPVLS